MSSMSIVIKSNLQGGVSQPLRDAVQGKIGHVIQKFGAEATSAACTLTTVHSDATQSTHATKVEVGTLALFNYTCHATYT
jgi:hypothetical protein